MNDLIVAEKIAQWQRSKALVLDSVSSPIQEFLNARRQVAGDQRGAAFVAAAENLEQKFGSGLGQWHEAPFVDGWTAFSESASVDAITPCGRTVRWDIAHQHR